MGNLARFVLPALFLAALPGAAQSRLPEDPALHASWLAWGRGDYDEALAGYLRVLEGPRGTALTEAIAGLTGELHPVSEIAPDGRALTMSPDGRWASFEVAEQGKTVTKLVSLPEGGVTTTLPGIGAALLGRDRLAYIVPRVTPEVEAAERAVSVASDPPTRQAALDRLLVAEARASELRLRELADGRENVLSMRGWAPLRVTGIEGAPLVIAVPPPGDDGPLDVLALADGELVPLASGGVTGVIPVPGGRWVIGVGGGTRADEVLLLDLESGPARRFPGRRAPTVSADGTTIGMIGSEGEQNTLEVLRPDAADEPAVLVRTPRPLDRPALSPSGALVAYQKAPLHDWELFVVPSAGGAERQLSWEIQHDLFPVFLDEVTVLALKGEARHRRSYVYPVTGGPPSRLFHNNTVRTIAPEYEWVATPDGDRVLIVAERDGDTVSPERGLYLVDRTRTVTFEDVRTRLEANLRAESNLRARGSRAFQPIGDRVRQVVGEVSVARIYTYAADLFRFGSRHIAQPGNAPAIDYLAAQLQAWGYEPELQWFEPRLGIRTANVIARLPGTVDPDLVYVVSSHFDSVERGPGSDDNSSGTSALLEAARVLRDHPQPATIEFAFFTGEEAGLLGSREYVRRAVAEGKRIVGALNNDMVGWTNDHRLDNTIRYSNPGIRDIQHAAAIFFSELITYDALYYKNTDAAAYYEVYGDIVGGIGSYPVLGNPHYHQVTDRLETVNQRLVAEVCRATVATVMLLSSSPARLRELAVRPLAGGELELTWALAPETGVTEYLVRYTDRSGALREERVTPVLDEDQRLAEVLRRERTILRPDRPEERPLAAPTPAVTRLREVRPGSAISVKAVGAGGIEGWDWATVWVPG